MLRRSICKYVAACGLGLAISGCAGGADTPAPLGAATPAPLGSVVPCAHAVETVDVVPDDYDVIGGVIAVPVERLHRLGRRAPRNDPDSLYRFAKFGLMVRGADEVQLHVGRRSQGNGLIDWGGDGGRGPVGSLAFAGCPDESSWRFYAGGIWALEPTCLQLTLVSETGVSEFELSVDRECEG